MSALTTQEGFEAWFTEKAKTLPLLKGATTLRYHQGEGQYVNDWALFGSMVWESSREAMTKKYEAARDRKNSITLLQMQRDRLLEALQELEAGSGTSPGANKKYKNAREAIAFATGKVKP